ncbi:MAG: 16S rRNA (guanine(966)-N(2))-methyltransferase RsmD [Burkholderiaceae bacterium]
MSGGRSARPGPRATGAPVRKHASGAGRLTPVAAPGAVRIIGGQWKRTRLPVPQRPGLRPTPDRVRETLFNWLGQDLTGWHCLDAFAGTGALGLEAASRGAQAVTLVESESALVALLRTVCDKLDATAVRVQRGDGVQALRACAPASLHLVLLDPPFEGEHFTAALQAAARAVRPGGWVYLEAPRHWAADELQALGLAEYRYFKAGMVHAHLLQSVAIAAPPAT